MSITDQFGELSDLLRRIESTEWTIEYVETKGEKLRSNEPLNVEIGVSSPALDELRDGSNVRIEPRDVENATSVLDVTIPPGGKGNADEDTSQEAAEEADGGHAAEADRTDDRSTSGSRSTDGNDESRTNEPEESRPAHHDPERLREVYEEHDTFAEMTDALGVDVTSQTVRHYMIRHGIHEPSTRSPARAEAESEDTDDGSTETSDVDRRIGIETNPEGGTDESNALPSDDTVEAGADERPSESTEDRNQRSDRDGETHSSSTGSADDDESSTDSADDERTEKSAPNDRSPNGEIDLDRLVTPLPNGVSIEEVRDAVRSASTMYEVQRRLGLEGSKTRTLLRELGLIDLVTGRLAYKPNQDRSLDEIETATDSTEEIERRIHEALGSSTSKA